MKTVILTEAKMLNGRGLVEAGCPVTTDTILANAWISNGTAVLQDVSNMTDNSKSSNLPKIESLRASIATERNRVGDEAYDSVVGTRRPDLLKDINKLTAIRDELLTLPNGE
jgi:hypothetical protein